MYSLSKVKQWIKKAPTLIYDAEREIITNGHVVIRAKSEMKPTILEAFGHLKGGFKSPANGTSDRGPDLSFLVAKPPADPTLLKDSRLRFNIEGKTTVRVLYLPETGNKILVDQKYVDLFKDFEISELVLAEHIQKQQAPPVQIIFGGCVVGTIAQFKPKTNEEAVLNTFEFKSFESEPEEE